MKTELDNIGKALKIAAKHKYGDGDYTAYFEKALADIKQVKERLEEKQEKVTRVEVIDNAGRSYVNMNAKNTRLSYQDDGCTLKIFID